MASDVGRLAGLGPAHVGNLGQMGQVLFAQLADRFAPGLHPPDGALDLAPAHVVQLGQVQHHADAADREHEHQEDRLLSGPRHIALHLLDARVAVALEDARHVEAIQEVLTGQEADLQGVAEDHLDDIEAGDALLPTYLGIFQVGQCPRHIGDLFHLQALRLLLSPALCIVDHDAIDITHLTAPLTTPVVFLQQRIYEGVLAVSLFG